MSGLEDLLNRRPPSAWDRFFSSPLLFLAQSIYTCSQFSPTFRPTNFNRTPIRVVCISDTHTTHNSQPPLPAGDILIHAGDLTQSGSADELSDALAWLSAHPHVHKLVIAGNHDSALADSATRDRVLGKFPGLVYLQDSAVELIVRGRALRVYGSPHTPKHGSWAFQYARMSPSRLQVQGPDEIEPNATRLWSAIPLLTDILITHGPPLAHLDLQSGCAALLSALWRVRPRLHVFGHIHGARGVARLRWGRVQSAYEDVCAGRSGWCGLVRLVWWTMLTRVKGMWTSEEDEEGEERTLLVNAAAVGGMKDDERPGAIVVEV